MKKLNIFIVFINMFLLLAPAKAEEKYYYAFNEKIFLNEVKNKIIVSFDNTHILNIQDNLQNNLVIRQMELQNNGNCYVLTTDKANTKLLREDLSKQAGIKYITPIYATNDGCEIGITDEIVIQFKKNVSKQKINEMHKRYNVTVKEVTDLFQIISVSIDADVIDIANAYQTSGLVNFSHPNFIAKVDFTSIPSDPYFINQFYLRNIGQSLYGRSCSTGADINVSNAWNITKGENIVVAVLDQGVTSNHPDLPNTRQIRLNGSNFGDGNKSDPSPTGNDNHGNACAGIIAASHNNEGIAGIAPNCKIMPIRISNSGGSFISVTNLAAAITFAKNNGADIISNSWSFNRMINPNYVPAIVDAISDATANGRNGKGCVVVFATGNTAHQTNNNKGYIQFPANVNVSGVLTVGASDRNDKQANYSPTSDISHSCNQIVDVVAPSHKAYSCQTSSETSEIWSIDIPGNAGYNPVKEDDCGGEGSLPIIGSSLPNTGINNTAYTGHFGGTSAACPQVAAVAALILSVNPNLTQSQVSSIIKSTARKAGGYSYPTNHSDGTWSNEMGYGVVDASAAVAVAAMGFSAIPTITGPDILSEISTLYCQPPTST
jgi:subtilisin family serine protease